MTADTPASLTIQKDDVVPESYRTQVQTEPYQVAHPVRYNEGMTCRRKQRRIGSRRTDKDGYKLPATKHQLREYPVQSGDFRLLTSAVAQGWPMSRDARAAVIQILYDVVLDDPLPANQIRAARVILAAERQNHIHSQKSSKRVDTAMAQIPPQVEAPTYDPELLRRRHLELMAQAASESKVPEARMDGRLPGLSNQHQKLIGFAERVAGRNDHSDDSST